MAASHFLPAQRNEPLSPLRLALFSGNYNYVTDGANRALNRLVAYLERQGVAVRVYSPTTATPAFKPQGTLVSVPSIGIPTRPDYRLATGLPKAIVADIEAFKPNLFHLSAPDMLGHAALKLAEKSHIPAVASVHTRFDTYMQYYNLKWVDAIFSGILKRFYKRCAHVYAPSRCMADLLEADGLAKDVHLWTRGVDCQRFNPQHRNQAWRQSHGVSGHDVVIAFAGRLVREKGLDTFVSIIRVLKQRGLHHKVVVMGDGPERAWFGDRLPEAIFLGHLNDAELATAYASSDIFLNPSMTESFGNVTLEAMASGLPAVCANATGSNSLVMHGQTGYLADALDPDSYADCLAPLITSTVLRQQIGQAGRKRSLGFEWDAVMADLYTRYLEVLEQQSSPVRQSSSVIHSVPRPRLRAISEAPIEAG